MNSTKCFECQTISENIQKLKQEKSVKDFQVLLYKFKDIQGLEVLFSNSRTFKACELHTIYRVPTF
jgi:hypothetical protein